MLEFNPDKSLHELSAEWWQKTRCLPHANLAFFRDFRFWDIVRDGYEGAFYAILFRNKDEDGNTPSLFGKTAIKGRDFLPLTETDLIKLYSVLNNPDLSPEGVDDLREHVNIAVLGLYHALRHEKERSERVRRGYAYHGKTEPTASQARDDLEVIASQLELAA